jgi:hypothetical protein
MRKQVVNVKIKVDESSSAYLENKPGDGWGDQLRK